MKRFKFRLETLLEIRKRKEDGVKRELGDKNQQIVFAQTDMMKLHDELKDAQKNEKENRRSENPDISSLRYSVAYRHKMKSDILKKGRQIDDLNADAYMIRQKLVNTTKDRKAIEIVKEHQFQDWKKEYHKQEQGFIDDVSQQGYIRKKGNGAHTSDS